IPSGTELNIIKPERLWYWTNFSPWGVCPFLIISITSIPAITFLAVCNEFNSIILWCQLMYIKLVF
ncbi:hypothetical protein, partial [Bacillus mycoides]|uniref:hypothetical protein n=1 Tax=Bacillus mycoides TaxID=1405 RepID=UPI0022B72FF5